MAYYTKIIKQWFIDALSASITAWSISIPIVIGHFSQFSPLAVPLSLLLMPFVAFILAIGAIRFCFGFIPAINKLTGHLLEISAHYCLDIVNWFSHIPLSSFENIKTSWLWVVIAMAWIICWCIYTNIRIYAAYSFLL